jgi:hypothetical protein
MPLLQAMDFPNDVKGFDEPKSLKERRRLISARVRSMDPPAFLAGADAASVVRETREERAEWIYAHCP